MFYDFCLLAVPVLGVGGRSAGPGAAPARPTAPRAPAPGRIVLLE